jgi:preprotein translocase subunit SecD
MMVAWSPKYSDPAMTRSTLLFLLVLSLAACNSQPEPKQVLVFKATPLPGATSADLAEAKRIVSGRLRAAKLKCQFQVKAAGSQLEVIASGAKEADLEKIKKYVATNATLEFAALADAEVDTKLIAAAYEVVGDVQLEGEVRGAWVPAADGAIPKPADAGFGEQWNVNFVGRKREVDGHTRREWLVVFYEPEARVTGHHLGSAEAGVDQKGDPALHFEMRPVDAWRMSMLTGSLRPAVLKVRNLAIIYNGQIISAPAIQSQINSRAMITGNFTTSEVEEMAILLGSGALPCALEFVKQTSEEN